MITRALPAGSLVDVSLGATSLKRGLARRLLGEVALVLGGVLLLALAARIAIALPFTPVPITGQTFAVLLIGAAYGWKRGAVTVALYLAAGITGLPVFAQVAGATTYGYLAGFLLAAVIVGWLAERGWDRRLPTALVAMLLGEVAIYACGLPWLARFIGWQHVVAFGLAPFVVGDAIKLALAALLLPAAWRLVRLARGTEPRA